MRTGTILALLSFVAIATLLWHNVLGQSGTFTPPDASIRTKAVGEMQSLSPQLQRTFDPKSDAFVPVSKPGQSDWLSQHPEPGQTFAQFLKARRNRPGTGNRDTLYIYPLGEFGKGARAPELEVLRTYSEAYFSMPTKVLRGTKKVESLGIKTRINSSTGKRQLLTKDILRLLPKKLPSDAFSMLAVTMDDLYPEESWNFVFGQASLSNRVRPRPALHLDACRAFVFEFQQFYLRGQILRYE